jgi:hypothetical protein
VWTSREPHRQRDKRRGDHHECDDDRHNKHNVPAEYSGQVNAFPLR